MPSSDRSGDGSDPDDFNNGNFCSFDLRNLGHLCTELWWTCCNSWWDHERRLRIDQQKALSIISRWNCRIKASSRFGGVGLFALRNLSVGVVAFIYRNEPMTSISVEQLKELGLEQEVGTAVEDLYYSSKAVHWVPLEEPTSLSYAAALNHSRNPSLELVYDQRLDLWKYVTIVPIQAGTELTIDYRTLVTTFGDDVTATARLKYSDPDAYFQLDTSDVGKVTKALP